MNDSLEYRLRSHLWALSQPRNPKFHLEAHLAARNYLREVLTRQGRTVDEQAFATPDDGEGLNLIGRCQDRASHLLVAHYDTVKDSPGADDNGSAVAVALEVAARCPQVEILLADLEEAGLLGARHYVDHSPTPVALTVVLESVGYWDDTPGSQSVPKAFPIAFPEIQKQLQEREFRGDFLALLHLREDTEAAKRLELTLTQPVIRVGIDRGVLTGPGAEEVSDFGRSDHLAFWQAGLPCLMLTDSANFRNPNYHRPSDTEDTLNFQQMVTTVQGLVDFFKT